MGYDDEAENAALARAGRARNAVGFRKYVHETEESAEFSPSASVALIEASGEIVDGSAHASPFSSDSVIAGDDLVQRHPRRHARQADQGDFAARRFAGRIGFGVGSDSRCGEEGASGGQARRGQHGYACGVGRILHLDVRQQHRGGAGDIDRLDRRADRQGLVRQVRAASWRDHRRYRRRQECAVQFRRHAVHARPVGEPQPPGRRDLCGLHAEGRRRAERCRYAQVQNIAKGRVWTGADAKPSGLVDELGGFWTAVADVKKLAGITRRACDLQVVPAEEGLLRIDGRCLRQHSGGRARDGRAGGDREQRRWRMP